MGNDIISFESMIENYQKKYNSEHQENPIVDYLPLNICATDTTYSILQFQPKSNLVYSVESGIHAENREYVIKEYNAFFSQSYENQHSLVLTPEYSTPLECVKKLIVDNSIPAGTLYCLCCEGERRAVFKNFLDEISAIGDVLVFKDAFSFLRTNSFVCCLLYVAKIQFVLENRNICENIVVIPQFKTTHMRDVLMEFESAGLCCGSKIIAFGRSDEQIFASFICSDVFNLKLLDQFRDYIGNNQVVIFNPQLNQKPHHGLFNFMRSLFIEYSRKDFVRIVSLNWARDTTLQNRDNTDRIKLIDPWSSLYTNHINKNLDEYLNIISNNASKGIDYAYSGGLGVWLFHPNEHIIDYQICGAFRAGIAEHVQETTPIKIKSCKKFNTVFNEEIEKICMDTVDSFFLNNVEYCNLISCNGCTGEKCTKQNLNKHISSLFNSEFRNEYRMFENGQLPRVTAKQYKSEFSKERLYIARRVHHLIKHGVTTKKFSNLNPIFQFFYDMRMPQYNVVYQDEEWGDIYCRVIYLKYIQLPEIEMIYNRLSSEFGNDIEKVVIYYEDESGHHVFPEKLNSSIIKDPISRKISSII